MSSWCSAIYNDESLRSDGDGTQSRDMVYVDDVVQANICASSVSSDFAGSVYNIGSGDSITNNEIIEKLRASFEDLQVTQAPARKGDVMHTLADVSSARLDLGFEPNFTFDKGLDATLTWWDDRFPDDDDDAAGDDWDGATGLIHEIVSRDYAGIEPDDSMESYNFKLWASQIRIS